MGTSTTMVPVDAIRTDGGTQLRAGGTDERLAAEYAAAMLDGAEFPPVVVFFDGVHYWLADGHHTLRAAQRVGLTEIAARVREGTKRDAILFAAGANEAHGKRRTMRDVERAIVAVLLDADWWGRPDSWVAKVCRSRENRVLDIRKHLLGRGLVPWAEPVSPQPAATTNAPEPPTPVAERLKPHPQRAKRDEFAEEMDEIARDLIAKGGESRRQGIRLQEIRSWLLTLSL